MSFNKEKFDSLVWTAITSIIAVLFAGNVWFARRTVERLDSIELSVWAMKADIAVLQATLRGTNYQKSSYRPSPGHPEREFQAFQIVQLIP